MEPRDGQTVVVWFSCGAASAVAAWLAVRCYGHRCRVRVVNNPILQEDPDNRRFLLDVERWIGVPIEEARSSEYPSADCSEVWERRRFMAGVSGAPCTMILKRAARQEWEARNAHDFIVMGFTADEAARADRFARFERSNILPLLIEAGLSKADCFSILASVGLVLPLAYRLGYPNANCIGCVKASGVTYWNHVRRLHPWVFAERAAQSRRLGARLVKYKGRRVFLDELPADAVGRPMKAAPDCSIFCEERSF